MKENKDLIIKILFFLSMMLCMLNIYFVKYVNLNDEILTHFFYIPAIIGVYLWGEKNIFATIFLSILLIGVDLLRNFSFQVLFADIIRVIIINLVTYLFSYVVEIKNKNNLMKKIVERNPIPTFVINDAHELIFMNKACETLTGFKAEENIGTKNHRFFFSIKGNDTYADLILNKSSEREILKNYMKSNFSFFDEVYEAEMQDKAGEEKFLQVSAISLLDENKNNKYVLENIIDITEFKKYSRLLKNSADKYQSLFELFPDYLIVHKDNKIIMCNDATLELFGMDIKWLLEKDISQFIHPDYREKFKISIEKLKKDLKKIDSKIFKIFLKDKFIDMEVSSNIFIQNNEKYIITILREIKNEVDIKIKEIIFSELFENYDKGIVIVDKSNKIQNVNKKFETLFQYKKEEVIEKNIENLIIDEKLISVAMKNINKSYKGEVTELETKRKRKDGFVLDVNIIFSPILINDVIQGCIIYYEDRSIFLQLENEKKDLQKQIFQLEKMQSLGEMLSSFAHELNNPLTSIIGYLYLLKSFSNSIENVDFARYIENASQEAERAGKITKELLNISRKNKDSYTIFDINEIINSLINLKSYNLMHLGIKLESKLEQNSLIVKGNKDKLQIVILNIINNAQYQLEKRENNKFIYIVTQKIDDYAYVHIIDNGGGISLGNEEKVFESFYTTKPAGQGTGLGLSVSRKIVIEHGGEIRAYNNEYTGASFEIKIPLFNDNEDSLEKEQIIECKYEILDEKSMKEKKIMIIDDEKFILDIIKNHLEQNGIKIVDAFLNPQDALRKLGFEKYDLILSDIKMPEINGFKLYKIIKDVFPYYKDKIVFLTGDTTNEEIQKKLHDERIICINKPFKLDDLMNTVRQKLI